MSWYRAGSVAVTNGSTNVTGIGTAWVANGIALGDLFTFDNVTLYEIQGLPSDTGLTLDRPYAGTTSSGSYAIIRNFSPANASMMTSVVALTSSVQSLLNSTTAPALGLANAFAPSAQTVPNMTVAVASAMLLVAGQPTVIAAQNTATITAPVSNPRIDIVVADIFTGAISVVTGTEAASPVQPAIPGGKIPIAKLSLYSGMTAIAATNVTDIRPIFEDGLTAGRINVKSFGARPDINVYATAIITMPATPAAGDTVAINGTTLTAVSGSAGSDQWQVTGSIANTLVPGTSNDVTRLVSAINSYVTNVTAMVGAGAGQIIVQWKDLSVAGNSVAVTVSSGYAVTDFRGNPQTTLTGATQQLGALNAVPIQNTIYAAALASGGYPFELFLPAGRYMVEATLYLPANVRLKGVATGVYGNPGTHLVRTGNFTLLQSTGVTSLVVTSTAGLVDTSALEDICLDGGDAYQAGSPATGTITFSAACAPGDTVTHRGVTFTAVSSGTTASATQFVGGVSAAADAASLLAALQASPSYLIQESTYRLSASATITITTLASGTAGNGYSLAKSGANIAVSGATLAGGGTHWTADLVALSACYEWKFTRVWFHNCAGRALKAQELWDSRFQDCRVTFCGSQDGTLPAISLLSGSYSPNYETCNNLYFWGCRFESCPGVCVEFTGSNGIDVWFTETKFECVQYQLDYLLRTYEGTSLHFDTCWMYVSPTNWATKSWSATAGSAFVANVGTINLTTVTGDTSIYAAATTLAQPVGMSVLLYASSDVTSWMTGRVNSYNSATGAIQIITDQAAGSTSTTAWTMVPCHPGLIYAHSSQDIKGRISGGAYSGNPGVTTTYLKCFVHLDNTSGVDLDLGIIEGTGTLIANSLLAYHDTTTQGNVGPSAGSGTIGTSSFTVETGRAITATVVSGANVTTEGDLLYIAGKGNGYELTATITGYIAAGVLHVVSSTGGTVAAGQYLNGGGVTGVPEITGGSAGVFTTTLGSGVNIGSSGAPVIISALTLGSYDVSTDWMVGQVVAYNAGTGALTVNVDTYGWGGVSSDVILSWIFIPKPAECVLITNPVQVNPRINVTGQAIPYSNQVSTSFTPGNLTFEGINIASWGGTTLLQIRNNALQDEAQFTHSSDFTVVSGNVAATGKYNFQIYDFARNGFYQIWSVDGGREFNILAPTLIHNLLRWYDGSDGGTYNGTTQLYGGGTYNQTQIRGSVFGAAYLPVDGSGYLTGAVGDVFLSTALAAGSASLGAPLVERYVCVAPYYVSGGTTHPATWMHPAPLQLSGTRAAAPTIGAIAYGYAQGTYYEYTDPIAGDFEGLKVVSNGSNLVWKTVRPISA